MKKKRNIIIALILILTLLISQFGMFTVNANGKIKSKSVSLNCTSVTLSVGDVVSLVGKMNPVNSTDKLTWSSSNKKIAKVTSNGVVTAIAEGNTTITVKTSSNKKATCSVKVKKYLTESEIISIIKSNTLSKEDVIKIVKSNAISKQEAIEIAKSNSFSREDIIEIVKATSLSEEDVIEILDKRLSVGSSNDWKDGTQVELMPQQAFPFNGENCTINNISISKYHCDDLWNGIPQTAKYIITIEGKVDESYYNKSKNNRYLYCEIILQYYTENGIIGDGLRYYPIYFTNDVEDGNLNQKEFILNDDLTFHCVFEQYNMRSDFLKYCFKRAEMWSGSEEW